VNALTGIYREVRVKSVECVGGILGVLSVLGMLDLRGVLSVLGLMSVCIHLPRSTDKCVFSIESASGVSNLLRVC